MEIRNAEFNENGTVDCEVFKEGLGWLPFTASPEDSEEFGREVFKRAKPKAKPNKKEVKPKEVILSNLAHSIRVERNRKLFTSDWTQLPDSQVNKSVWATYRQALRDVPQQKGFPETFTWPLMPTEG